MRDHDASGLPRYWKHEAVLEDGFVESDIWEVLEYAENIPIPEDVFAFATPSGYSTFVATPTQTTMRFADGRVHTSAGTEAQPKQTGKWLLMVNAIIAIVLIGRVYRRRRMARR